MSIKYQPKIFATAILIFSLTMSAIYLYVDYQITRSINLETIFNNGLKSIYKKEVALQERIDNLKETLLTIKDSRCFEQFKRSGGAEKFRLRELFHSFIKNHNQIMQIRFLDRNGFESVRVDKFRDGEVKDTLELQDKSNRYYFKDTIKLNRGEVYISDLDLNIENRKIEKLLKPTFRVATPIYIEETLMGVLIINSFADEILEELLNSIYYRSILTDKSGNIIMDSESKFNWSRYLSDGYKVQNIIGDEVTKMFIEDTYRAEDFISKKLNVEFKNDIFLILKMNNSVNSRENSLLNDKMFKLGLLLFALSVFASTILYFMMREIEVSKRLANFDKLTGIYNRRIIDSRFKKLFDQHTRRSSSLSFMIVDVDHFKRVNDTFGHQAGDKVLVELSSILLSNTRNSDTVGRWGGEEFVVIAPETAVEEATNLAERIRIAVEKHNFSSVDFLTVSIGLTTLHKKGDSIENIVERADSSLYQAKESGRNRVVSRV